MNKKQEALLSLFYSIGSQPEASKNKDNEIYIKFANAVNREAKKRNIGPLEYLERLETNKKERLQLIAILEKKHPKFSKIYEHANLEKIKRGFLGPGKLKKTGKAFLNEEFSVGEVEVWEGNGIEYMVKPEHIIKFQAPKVSVSQLKNLSVLMGLIQEQQFNEPVKRARCKFTLSLYGERRGHTKKEIGAGGKFLDELRRDIYSGAYTTYKLKTVIDGKNYLVHNTFYGLYVPTDKGGERREPGAEWIIDFNEPYSAFVLELLNRKPRQFFITDPKAIADRTTTKRPYLFYFYRQLVIRKQKYLTSLPVKVQNLLVGMQVRQKILDRPKECFKLLHECINYFSEHYQPHPEIESFNIYSGYPFKGSEVSKITLSVSEGFKGATYSDFKDILKDVNVKDIREAYISFKRPYKEAKKKDTLNDKETKLFNKTMRWINEWVTKIPLEDRESMIKMYIKKIGAERYEAILNGEGNKTAASAVHFLTKALPAYLKDKDKRPPGYKKYRVLN